MALLALREQGRVSCPTALLNKFDARRVFQISVVEALRSSSCCNCPRRVQDWSLSLALALEVSRELLQHAVSYVPYIHRRAHMPL
jgi:hypothetical protein